MPVFNLFIEQSLGISHSGEVVAYGDGTVELTDEQVQQLVALIREHGGETNVKALQLQNAYPEIYQILDDAYRDVAQHAEYDYWVIEGYENGWYEEPDDAVEKCQNKYGFKYVFDEVKYREENGMEPDEEIPEERIEDAQIDAFSDWVEDYRTKLTSEEEVSFLSDVFGIYPEVDDVDYEVRIPEEIIELANKR